MPNTPMTHNNPNLFWCRGTLRLAVSLAFVVSGVTLGLMAVVAELAPNTGANSASANAVSSALGSARPARSWLDDPRAAPLARILARAPVRGNVVPPLLQRPAVQMPTRQLRRRASGSMAAASASTPGVITTFAGQGSGDGGPANTANLSSSGRIFAGSDGTLYISDFGFHNRLRAVDSSGTIQTVAGTGSYTFSGDGGPATAAAIYGPDGMAQVSAGNLYITDYFSCRVRKIDTSGIITTYAGSGICEYTGDFVPATLAGVAPGSLAMDANDNLYIADSFDFRIRKVDRSTGIITTVAGNGTSGCNEDFTSCQDSGDGLPAVAATLSFPITVTVDPAGNLYIVSYRSSQIRKVDTSGIISTVAGNGYCGTNDCVQGQAEVFSGDGGPAINASLGHPIGFAVDGAGNFYIADNFNHRIRKVDASGIISTVAGDGYQYCAYNALAGRAFCQGRHTGDGGPATEASLSHPADLTVDPAGNIYFVNTDVYPGQRIRKIDLSGTITTFAGNGTEGFSGDGMLSTRADIDTGFNFYGGNPFGTATDEAGNLYIADRFNNRIRKVDAVTGIITTVAGDGYIDAGLKSDGFYNAQGRYSGDGGPATQASLNFPEAVAVDTGGNLYIADTQNNRIRKVDSSGVISTVAGTGELNGRCIEIRDNGPATSACLSFPNAVAVDTTGNLFIKHGIDRVRKVDANGVITTYAGGNNSFNPDPNCPPGSSTGETGPATCVQLDLRGIALDAAGNLYISDGFNAGRVRKVDASLSSDGTRHIQTVAGNGQFGELGDGGPATAATIDSPRGLAVDLAGNLFIGEYFPSRVRKVDRAGIITTIAGGGPGGEGGQEYGFSKGTFCGDGGSPLDACLSYVGGLAVDGTGSLYIATMGPASERIRKVAGIVPLPIDLIRVVSRKVHGSAGPFDIELPHTGASGIEPRSGRAGSAYQVVFTFAASVTLDSASVTPAAGKTAEVDGPPVVSPDGKEVTVNLKNVSNAQRVTIKLLGVSDGTNSNDVSVQMGVLLGDTTGDGVVNSGDITQTRRQSGQITTEANKRIDLSTDGVINSGDITLVRRQSGTALPTP